MKPEYNISHTENQFAESLFIQELKKWKIQLLTGRLTPQDLRTKLLQADQSSDDRKSSKQIYSFLKDPEIEEFLTKDEFKGTYHIFRSFITLHYAQNVAINDRNELLAVELFTESLQQKQIVADEIDPESFYYLQATLAYFSQDVSEMRRIVSKINPNGDNAGNIVVIERLISGLEKFGSPKYARDYAGIME